MNSARLHEAQGNGEHGRAAIRLLQEEGDGSGQGHGHRRRLAANHTARPRTTANLIDLLDIAPIAAAAPATDMAEVDIAEGLNALANEGPRQLGDGHINFRDILEDFPDTEGNVTFVTVARTGHVCANDSCVFPETPEGCVGASNYFHALTRSGRECRRAF